MGANIAGIYGAQIFRADDRPRYRRAFGVCIGVLAAGLVLAVVRHLDGLRTKKRKARGIVSGDPAGSAEVVLVESGEVVDKGRESRV